MSRIPYITQDRLTDAQKRVFDHITQGKRAKGRPLEKFLTPEGGLQGPYNIFLYSPDVGDAVQRLGEAVRFETLIPPKLKELAILVVGAKMKAQYEWWAHERIGRKHGLDEGVMKSLKAGEQPDFDSQEQALVFKFCRELLETGRISDRLYAKAVELLGEAGLVELVFLLGYYTTVAMILNVFEISVPDGEQTPFPKNGHENHVKNGG